MAQIFIDRSLIPNVVADVGRFRAQWDDAAHPANAETFPLGTSAFGNINNLGEPAYITAPDLTPHHPQFRDAVEAGVRDLVFHIVDVCGWITYTSCQGHRYEGTELAPAERHVGILPRSTAERAAILNRLTTALTGTGSERDAYSAVQVGLALDHLTDETGGRFPTVELWFQARGGSWDDYFEQIDKVDAGVLRGLSAARV